MSQIIVPLGGVSEQARGTEDSLETRTSEPVSEFKTQVGDLQARAREDLVSARENAKIKLQDIINTRKKLRNRNLFNLLGLPPDTKVSSCSIKEINQKFFLLIWESSLTST